MFRAIFTLAFLALSAALTSAAEYKIRMGDTLTSISRKTGFTVTQLAAMNEINDVDRIYAGDRIAYFDKRDLTYAKLWAQLKMRQLPMTNMNHQHFGYVIKDIGDRKFRLSIKEPDGTHFMSILTYAKAYQKHIGR